MAQTFIKTKEDFICEQCGAAVRGTGYTNHCPACLWSKHVDINPGDRASSCGGLMVPIGYEKAGNTHLLIHRCVKCGAEKRNKMNLNDDLAQLAAL